MFIKKNKTDIQTIKVVFYTKNQIIKEIKFKVNSSIREIFDYFRNNIRNEGYSLKSNYKIFSKKVNEYETISNLIKMDKNDILLEGEIWIEVEESLYFDDENDETFKKILQPKINPFELIEYNPSRSKIKFIECSKDFILFHSLNKFTKESAFCNSNNSLFISGGEMAGKAINNFWIINKNDYKITKKIMPIDKKYHSMLYIPDSFIIIAGGNSLETLIYDIEKQVFIKWANMNKKHFQPALFNYGKYVYAFSALNSDDINKNYFERTNLTSDIRKWEKIFPNFDKNVNKIKLVNHFFAISKSTNGNILFIGGEKYNKNYLYNPITNTFSLASGKNAIIPFWDKTFYKISKKYNVSIPLNFCMNYKLGLVNKETQSLYEINCDKKTGEIKFNLDIGKEKNSNSGNIYIQTLIKNVKNRQSTNIQIGLNPRNIIQKNQNNNDYDYEYDYFYEQKLNNDNDNYNNNYNDEINLGEERLIVENWHSDVDNSDMSKSKNYTQKKSQLLIPDAAIDEQIINREIDLNGDIDKENINKFEKLNSNNINKDLNNNFNDDYNDEGRIFKEELIFVGDSNEEDESNNKINYYKSHSSSQKPFLYISNSILDDQIINRQLIKNGNEQNENWENIIYKNNKEEGSEVINNNQNEEENNVEEEEILSFNYGNNEYEKNDFSREKKNKNNKCLYIQFSSIDDQITDRKVNINENDIKKIKNIIKREDSKPYIRKKVGPNKNAIISAKKNVNTYKFLENENDNLKESEIIINNRLNTEGNEMKTKISKNSLKIFVPEYVIEDQFVNREVCPDNK